MKSRVFIGLGSFAFASIACLGLARGAAATVIVDYGYDDTNSTLTVSSPAAVSIPPQGTLEGTVRISYSSNSSGDIVNGPATLDVFDLNSNLNIQTNLGGAVSLTGPASTSLEDPVEGTLTGNQLSFGGAMGMFHAFGSITCTGTPCAFVSLPSGTPVAFDGTGSVPLPTLTVASIHGTISGLSFTVGDLTVTASLLLNGSETGRVVVPEPNLLSLLGAGAALGLLRRRR
ncbi:MAG TPA: PEP-CTERM sorting domain-containing protein [Myxococcota bacterium]|nr:PEP-CTERM sorting domain-containing protein [Myxococcota bacterium]